MKARYLLLALLLATPTFAAVEIDMEGFGTSLGGWKARKGKAAEYEISEALYRTYQPETSPSPDGGIFVSVRIDHVRGFMASDDHASLELSFAADGTLVTAQSSLALQGRTISSELIKGGASASTSVAAPYVDRAVKIGTDLVADLSSKLLREKIVEAGRVSFPAAIRHNYNLLYQAVRTKAAEPKMTDAKPPESLPEKKPETPPATPEKKPEEAPKPPPQQKQETVIDATTGKPVPLPDVKSYNPSGAPGTPLPEKKEKDDKSGMLDVGKDVLKIARDVVKDQTK
ncbi:hypothetical protein [Brevifollis gellanilyticus]|uniref:Uncharacterized protein n=1 Tax=Brevifollis gellanilyticus TaxID=748831 RepID=A0A512MA73_9BACT|nr:hypothetical protein [Brevifollis gellanilyticus]GEP43634.1 hypothetical protein BGE01nite_29250 [Brevifollis gellanilyticus]